MFDTALGNCAMSLLSLYRTYLDATNPNYVLDNDRCIIAYADISKAQRIVVVIEFDEAEEYSTFTAVQVINVNEHLHIVSAEKLYRQLLMIDNPLAPISASMQLDDEGYINVEISCFLTAENQTKRRFDLLFSSVVFYAEEVKNALASLTLDASVPEGLKSLYSSHISTISRDDVTIAQLKETQAILEGFLKAEFSESFNALLQKDLKFIASKLQQLAPMQF